MELKAQDTLLAVKYWSLAQGGERYSLRELADLLGISAGEISKSTQRLLRAQLLVERDDYMHARKDTLLEWLCFGVRYAYPFESVGYGRGLATSWNCLLVESEMSPLEPAWVWAMPSGKSEGVLVKPIHPAIPLAASKDENLYQMFALVEAIRGGKPRELSIARDTLKKLLKKE